MPLLVQNCLCLSLPTLGAHIFLPYVNKFGSKFGCSEAGTEVNTSLNCHEESNLDSSGDQLAAHCSARLEQNDNDNSRHVREV